MNHFLTEAAKGRNTHGLWYVFTTVCIFIAFVIGQVPLILVVQQRVTNGHISSEQAAAFYETADFDAVGIHSTIGLALLLMSFILALVVLIVLVKYLHGRPVRSLIASGSINWRKFFFALIVWFVLTACVEGVLYAMDPEVYQLTFNWGAWLPLMIVVLLLLPLQTTFEELFVRSYLMQRIAVAFNRPWPAVLVTSILFGVMHLGNPEIAEFGLGPMMVYYISVGLALGAITVWDDGLEYALGIHAATNIYGAGFVTYTGSALQTEALMRVEIVNPGWMIAFFYLSIVLFIVFAKYKFGLGSWKQLFRPLRQPVENNSIPESIDQTNYESKA